MGWERVIAESVAAGGPVAIRAVADHLGMHARTISRRADREGWERPFPCVVAVPGTVMDGRAWARAATLHAAGTTGEPGKDLVAATRATALALFGVVRSFPTRVEVVVPAPRVVRPHPRLAVTRSRLLVPTDVRPAEGIPVLTGLPLLRDLAAVRDVPSLRAAAIDLAQAGIVDLDALPAFLAALPPFPGKPRLRRVAADLLGAGRTDSPFELEVRERLAGEGIALDRGQVRLPGPEGIHLDLGIAAIRFGIECDSLGFHGARTDLDRDATRANVLATVADNWRVLHATWSVLTDGWGAFVDQARQVIAEQSRRYLGTSWPAPEHLR